MEILFLSLAGLNRWPRGQYSWGPWVVGVVLAAITFAVTGDATLAPLVGGLYVLGESWGWGKWIGVIPLRGTMSQADYNKSKWPARDDGKNNGIHALANRIAPETKDFARYGNVALALRGIWWWAPVYIALAAFGAIPVLAVLVAVPVGVAFPISCLTAYRVVGKDRYWSVGEVIYGAVQGAALAACLWI